MIGGLNRSASLLIDNDSCKKLESFLVPYYRAVGNLEREKRLTVPQVQTFGTELEWENLVQIILQNQRRRVRPARTTFGTLLFGAGSCTLRRIELGLEALVRDTDNTVLGCDLKIYFRA